MIRFTCQCGRGLKAKPELAGKQARCQDCSEVVTIPEPAASNSEPIHHRVTITGGIQHLDLMNPASGMLPTGPGSGLGRHVSPTVAARLAAGGYRRSGTAQQEIAAESKPKR